MAEVGQLLSCRFRQARLEVEPARLVVVRLEAVGKAVRREACYLDGLLGVNAGLEGSPGGLLYREYRSEDRPIPPVKWRLAIGGGPGRIRGGNRAGHTHSIANRALNSKAASCRFLVSFNVL